MEASAVRVIGGLVFVVVLGVKLWVEFTGTVLQFGGWPEWITAVATAFIAGAAVVALLSVWDARKTRNAQIILDLSRRWEEPIILESQMLYSEYGVDAVIALVERLYPTPGTPPRPWQQIRPDIEDFVKLSALPNLIELIGALNLDDTIDTDLIFENWGPIISAVWSNWEKPIARLRQLDRHRLTYRNFERLAGRMNAREIKEAR